MPLGSAIDQAGAVVLVGSAQRVSGRPGLRITSSIDKVVRLAHTEWNGSPTFDHGPRLFHASNRPRMRTNIQDVLLSTIGILALSFALKGLLIPNHFFDGGVTGVALLINEVYHVNIAFIIVALNLPFIALGARWIGRSFALRSLVAILALGLCLLFIPFPIISNDKLIIAVFGGFFIGLGIGLGIRGGVSLDGIEILAVFTGRRVGFSMSEIILGMNILIFAVAALFFGLESAFYSVLTYFVATRTIDYVVEGFEEFMGITIVSARCEEVKRLLVQDMGKGITIYKGERGFLGDRVDVAASSDIVFIVISRLEMRKIKNAVQGVDPQAFIFSNVVKETAGGLLKHRRGH